MNYKDRYNSWIEDQYIDEDTKKELGDLKDNEAEIEDRFYKDLEFGTAGLRGKLGAGTNRMNVYNISKVTQGLADYIKSRGQDYVKRGVAIAYDCRHFSSEFAKTASLVLAGNGIKAFLFESLRPTPELSFAVRTLGTAAGIVVTASHNPREYNGYKVYFEDGAQILSEMADSIVENIEQIKSFNMVKTITEDEALNKGLLNYLGKEMDDMYVSMVKDLSIRDDVDKSIKIVYTPLNGTGNILVRRVLNERGFTNIIVVPEQECPDPDFTTVGYPNPEDTKAFKYAEALGKKEGAELLIATDPDCDRLAIEVRDHNGEYVAFTGNQTGAILIKYILEGLKAKNKLPKNGAIVKSIVTGDLGKRIAMDYGVKTYEALTGFKNICGKIPEFEKTGEAEFIFGYEESIGYVTGTKVRDKDGVSSSMLLCEAAAYYKSQGKTLIQVLDEVYSEYGYYREKQISLVLEGVEGKARIERMMVQYRDNFIKEFNGAKLEKYTDFNEGTTFNIATGEKENAGIPKSDVLKFIFDDKSWYALRPSGTEPKIKLYIYTIDENLEKADRKIKDIETLVLEKLDKVK
ncbi:phospho-sugar mutase [Clostridium algidicarnis]|uniref:phospho-sugar mutase n=1 Tax=Clostridium algidicarnis TaxID=37659 RepID=UPI001C0AB120|nr:phospho-sugar mutase [Clostridium algidicarnis]MBU3228384.1 phospho-sugar mutase [Clostridium algidicarnis]MBU3251441.1 phospho-sugar mutase [Clostridium algidicarnis]